MLFNSYIFVLFFLPLCLTGYFGLAKCMGGKAAKIFLLGMSLWFYGYFNVNYLLILLTSVLTNFVLYKLMFFREGDLGKQKSESDMSKRNKILLSFGILINFVILFYFKYFDFCVENINNAFHTDFVLRNVLLPLGISFFTFQQLSFIIDACKGEVPEYTFLDYALFVTYFPQLIAGPIAMHNELVPQFQDETKKKVDWGNIAKGLYLFAVGMAKKVLIADTLGNVVNWGFSNIPSLDSTNALVVMVSYTLQIYFDFSGYCDMAMGIGKMMNIELPMNFNSPYKAVTINEFWARWHMTLTRFLTKYVYIPLGGNRKGEIRTYINIMGVFLLSGLWHGANWTFVIWGVLHGLFSVIARAGKKVFERFPIFLNWFITFLFVNVTWVLFRSDSIQDARVFLSSIGSLKYGYISHEILECFHINKLELSLNYVLNSGKGIPQVFENVFAIGVVGMILLFALVPKNVHAKLSRFKTNWKSAASTVLLLFLSILSFAGVSTFLYFNF